jgi:hypothetical protein
MQAAGFLRTSAPIVEAFEWLKDRGLAELVTDAHGECIQLRKIARVA